MSFNLEGGGNSGPPLEARQVLCKEAEIQGPEYLGYQEGPL